VEAPPVLQDGGVAVLMALEVTHLGKPGETDAELATVELLFEEQPGTPLTYVEVNDLIETLSVFRDDGDGVFDSNADEHVTSVEFLSLIDGRLTVLLVDGATSCGVVWGAPGLFFVVVQATPDASAQSPNSMVVTHLIDERTGGPVSTIEDRNHDIALQLLDAANVTSSPVSFVEPGLIFADGFESGGTSAWSSTLP
jgi:hypothetical protein